MGRDGVKNVIPSSHSAPCSRALEVWILSPNDKIIIVTSDSLGLGSRAFKPYLVLVDRIAKAYEFVVDTCRGVTQRVLFRRSLWDVDLWESRWKLSFVSLVKHAKDALKSRGDQKEWGALADLVVAQKMYGYGDVTIILDATDVK